MNENIIAEDVRILVKKLNMKISFFKPEDQKDTAENWELWRIGGFKSLGITKDEIRKLLEENGIEDIPAANDQVIDILISVPVVNGHKPAELLEMFIGMDNSSIDMIEINNDTIMRVILKDMANCIVEENIDSLVGLNNVVRKYNGVYEGFQQEFWISDLTKDMDKTLFMELFRTTGLYYMFYKNVVEPQIREAYPHWFLNQ